MKKHMKLCKKLFAFVLAVTITFGSSIVPVSALEKSFSEEIVTKEEVLNAYNDFKAHKNQITDKINEINSGTPSAAKKEAVDEANEALNEINSVFNNDTVTVTTTAYNIITVLVDFKDTENLGLTITNEKLKNQAYLDTKNIIAEYDNMVTFVLTYLNQSEDYTVLINNVGNTLDLVSNYVDKLEILDITYDRNMYQTYIVDFATLMISEANPSNIEALNDLETNINNFNTSLISLLSSSLLEKFNSLESLVNSKEMDGLDSIKASITYNKSLLVPGCDLLQITDNYLEIKNNFEQILNNYEQDNPNQEYINTNFDKIEEELNKVYNSTLTIDQINSILEIATIQDNTKLTLELLVNSMDQDKLADKLVAGEINYDTLEAFVELNNNNISILSTINEVKNSIENSSNPNPSKDELNQYFETMLDSKLFSMNSYFMDKLNNLNNASKTEEERLEILNKINLVEFSINKLNATLNKDITLITDKISELKEFYSKSCDNTLKNLIANNIELDLTKENQTITVGHDVTSIELIFEANNPNAKVEVLNNTDLKVGENTVLVIVTAPNGEVRQYTLTVVRQEKEASNLVTTVSNTNQNNTEDEENSSVETVKVSTEDSTALEDDEKTVDNEEKSNTSDSSEKYNEEIEEDEGTNGLIILIIVVGIALVGFGIYKLFGDKEGKKIEKSFGPNLNSQNKKSNNNQIKQNTKKRK